MSILTFFTDRKSLLLLFGCGSILLLAWVSYSPGLSGGFLFDDFVNLDALGKTGPIDNWRAFCRYITSGTADPTGRPLALLSFLIDARNWPADPGPFLRTNIVLHLVNGALLFALLRALGRWLDRNDHRNDATALLGAGLWLLHPLFVSTTLYVVQREAMLPATFTLLGLLGYVHGRACYAQAHYRRGMAWMIVGIGLGTALATLSKANGILLPLLAWVLDATVLRPTASSRDMSLTATGAASYGANLHERRLQWLRLALLVVPSVVTLVYLATFLRALHAPIDGRPWTIAQRLLTEPRVLLDYLQLLIVPRSVSSGLYNDAYVASTGLLQPWRTFPSLVLVLGLPVLAFWNRRRFPALAAAILFYFVGQLLESTVVSLELYFEHRNYLPAMLLFWPIARGLSSWRVSRFLRIGCAGILLALLALTTYQRAELWGKPDQLAALWAKQSPKSSRAQSTLAMFEMSAGHPDVAAQRLAPLWRRHPNDLQLAFNYIDAECAWHGISDDDAKSLANTIRNTDASVQLIPGWLDKAIDIAGSDACPGLSLEVAERWVSATLQNPNINNAHVRDQDIAPLSGKIALRRKQPDIALQHFNRALAAFTTPDVAARQVSTLARNGYFRQALQHLDNYERLKSNIRLPGRGMPRLHAKVLEWQGYWPHEMAALRMKLHAEIDAKSSSDAAAP
jgi:hypothetical protein